MYLTLIDNKLNNEEGIVKNRVLNINLSTFNYFNLKIKVGPELLFKDKNIFDNNQDLFITNTISDVITHGYEGPIFYKEIEIKLNYPFKVDNYEYTKVNEFLINVFATSSLIIIIFKYINSLFENYLYNKQMTFNLIDYFDYQKLKKIIQKKNTDQLILEEEDIDADDIFNNVMSASEKSNDYIFNDRGFKKNELTQASIRYMKKTLLKQFNIIRYFMHTMLCINNIYIDFCMQQVTKLVSVETLLNLTNKS